MWSLTSDDGQNAAVPFTARMHSDDMVTLKRAAEFGLGVIALPACVCRAEVEAGRLRGLLLPGWTAGQAAITMLMSSRRRLLPAVRVLADFLAAEMPSVVAPASS